MKVLNKALQVLALVLSLAAAVLFFAPFVKFVFTNGESDVANGLTLAFGSKFHAVTLAKSSKLLFCFILAVLSTALNAFTFFAKSKKVSYFASGVTLGTAIYMLVVALSNPFKFVDTRPFGVQNVASLEYKPFVLIVALVLVAAAFAAIGYMLVNDYLAVKASKGGKQLLVRRVIQFFKDYKSECKKIVWPGLKEVVKNTGIVLIMCAVIGALIWLADWGLGSLLKAVW